MEAAAPVRRRAVLRRKTSDYTDTPLWQQILRFVVPITATYALEGAATLVPIWAAAHGGNPTEAEATRRVGAVGLGNTVVICVALVVKSGWTGAQDTLVSQAHGLKDHRKARDHLNCCQILVGFEPPDFCCVRNAHFIILHSESYHLHRQS